MRNVGSRYDCIIEPFYVPSLLSFAYIEIQDNNPISTELIVVIYMYTCKCEIKQWTKKKLISLSPGIAFRHFLVDCKLSFAELRHICLSRQWNILSFRSVISYGRWIPTLAGTCTCKWRQFFLPSFGNCSVVHVVRYTLVFGWCCNLYVRDCRLCNKEKIPMIPFGTGTGLEGGVTAVKVRTHAST